MILHLARGIARDALANTRKRAKHSTSRDSKGVAKGGPGVAVTPFCKPFLIKEPTTGDENAKVTIC